MYCCYAAHPRSRTRVAVTSAPVLIRNTSHPACNAPSPGDFIRPAPLRFASAHQGQPPFAASALLAARRPALLITRARGSQCAGPLQQQPTLNPSTATILQQLWTAPEEQLGCDTCVWLLALERDTINGAYLKIMHAPTQRVHAPHSASAEAQGAGGQPLGLRARTVRR